VVFTAAMACVILATATWLIDVRGWKPWAGPSITFGLNPVVAFVGSGAMARMLGLIHVPLGGESVSLQQAIYRVAFASWLAPRNASLGYALLFVLLWFGILKLLERKGLILKV
jgi:predicted acyltransferase